MKTLKTLFFLLFIIYGFSSLAQHQHQKIDTLNLKYSYLLDPENINEIDTLLFHFQQFNPQFSDGNFYASNGSLGSISKSLVLDMDLPIGFVHHPDIYQPFLHTPENSKVYLTKRPFTDVFYANSPGDFQYLKIAHGQHLGDYVNINAFYDLISSSGLYAQQSNGINNISVNVGFKSKNDRLKSKLFMVRNRVSNDENGGLADPIKDFEEDSTDANREFSETALKASESIFTGNKYVQKRILLETSYLVNIERLDSVSIMDTLNVQDSSKVRFYVKHRGDFQNTSMWYEDPNPQYGFYKNIFLDATTTMDSNYFNRIDNSVSAILDAQKLIGTEVEFGLKHSYVWLRDPYFNTNISQLDLFLRINTTFKGFQVNVDAAGIIGDYNQGDMILKSEISKSVPFRNTKLAQKLQVKYSRSRAPWVYNRFISNHYVWGINLDKESRFSLSYQLNEKPHHFRMLIRYANISNHVYLDDELIPKQNTNSFNYYRFSAAKDFIGNRWKSNVNISLQHNDGETLRLPNLIANASVQYGLPMFKGALFLYPGLELTFLSGYYADSYMPALRMFYIQNEKELEPYPYLDAFVNIKIKQVRVFFKYAHVNSGLSPYQYYTIPTYPMKDRNFHFGLSWIFIN